MPQAPAPLTVSPNKPLSGVFRACRQSLYLVFFFTFLVEVTSLAPIIYMWNIFDRVVVARSGVTLISLTVLVVAVDLFWSAVSWMRTRLLIRVSLRVDWDLAADVFDAAFRRSVGRRQVNVQQVMSDLLALRQFTTGDPILALMSAPFALIFVIVGVLFHPYLALFILVAVVLMLLSAFASNRISTPVLKAANDENSESQRVATESLRAAETTLALGMLPAIRQRWYERHRAFLTYSVNASEATGLIGGFSRFLSLSLPSLQIALGAWLAINGKITGGMVFAASMLISRAVSPITRLAGNWDRIVGARVAYERLNLLLAEDRQFANRMALPAPKGKLEVVGAAGVPFAHNRAVVSDLNFSIQPGQALAIIGPSGSGKTSLTRLLVGVWKPAIGSVRLDGVELSEWNHDEVGPHIGFVPQEVAFQEGTIAENIARLGEVDADEVIKAATLVEMHETILGFPDGYETRLGDSGFALSGGQRQRLAIARAFYRSPKYIVMDEPNASLDELGESALMRAIATLKEQGTSFAITTHRPRLMSVVDNLLILRQGRQVGFGAAAELIAAVRNLQVVSNDDGAGSAAARTPAGMGTARPMSAASGA